jgi:hypothetical protein
MITVILLAIFALIAITFGIVAYSANQRRRANQSGTGAVVNQEMRRPRATPPSE